MSDSNERTSSEVTAWPELDLAGWSDTRDTLHLWTQIVGKVRLAVEPMINHWWQVPLYVSSRGLTTSLMHADSLDFEIEFDFVDQVLRLQSTDGNAQLVELAPRSVADFYQAVMDALKELGVVVEIYGQPSEIADAIPFERDHVHHLYDADAAHRFWIALVRIDRVMKQFRARFIGKASPIHFFWGAPDLATSRFSGRTAPKHRGGVPNCPDRVQVLAYSHEVSSCGFWPGGDEEGLFYAYAYPQPPGFAEWPVKPSTASYNSDLGEFLLPYRAVRTAERPEDLLLEFFQSTYEAAAELANWDRAALEFSA